MQGTALSLLSGAGHHAEKVKAGDGANIKNTALSHIVVLKWDCGACAYGNEAGGVLLRTTSTG